MAKAKKDGKFVTAYLKSEIVKQLDDYCEQTSMAKTAIIELALKEYLEKRQDKEQK